jgi:hypothetical protein
MRNWKTTRFGHASKEKERAKSNSDPKTKIEPIKEALKHFD